MINFKIYLLALLLPLLRFQLKAQDIHFSQFYANPLYLNPAFAGSEYCSRFSLNYRNQWPNLSGSYVTYSCSYDRYIEAIAGGIGLLVTSDNQAHGTLKTATAGLIYSYNARVNRFFSIKTAMQASWFQKTLDKNRLNFGDMIDARRGFVWNTAETMPSKTKSNVDFSAGILGYGGNYFFGLTVNHLNQPDEGLLGPSKLPVKYTAQAGGIIQIDKRSGYSISPNIIFQQQQKFTQLNLGLYYMKESFVAGLWYRNNDAVIILIGLHNRNFKLGYSYDVTISRLSGNTAGAHEISFQVKLNCKKKGKKYRTVVCPSF